MPDRPGYTFNPKTGLYCKKIKNPLTGKYLSVYGHTPEELSEKVVARKAQLEEEAFLAADSPLVREYAETWFRLNTKGLSASRVQDYRSAIDLRINPVIGDMRLAVVRPDDVRAVMVASADMSRSVQQKLVTTRKRIFDAAEENGYIAKSPCGKLKAGGEPPDEKTALTPSQVITLLAAVRGTRAERFCLLGLYAGLRREEICALQWDCVFLDAPVPYITVRRAVRWENNNRPVVSDKLKSRAAKRDIPIAPQLLAPLRDARAAATSRWVIPDASGNVMSFSSFQNLWGIIERRSTGFDRRKGPDGRMREREKKLGDAVAKHNYSITIDFHVTPHLLRHTFITNLILSGANVKTVQYLAGHATAQMTLNVYTHLIENQPSDTIGAISAAFGPKP